MSYLHFQAAQKDFKYQLNIHFGKNLVVFTIYDVQGAHKPQIAKFTSPHLTLKSLHLALLIVPRQSENNYQSNIIINLFISQFLIFDE